MGLPSGVNPSVDVGVFLIRYGIVKDGDGSRAVPSAVWIDQGNFQAEQRLGCGQEGFPIIVEGY